MALRTSHVCWRFDKVFWTVGIDGAGELVRNYETLLSKEFGGIQSHLSFDDFLRIYDYHEQSILRPARGLGSNRGWGIVQHCDQLQIIVQAVPALNLTFKELGL